MSRKRSIQWAAPFKSRVNHAYVPPERASTHTIHWQQVCRPRTFLASPEWWRKERGLNVRRRCARCQALHHKVTRGGAA